MEPKSDPFDGFGMIRENMRICLSAAVPLRILEIQRQGGPTEDDWIRVRANAEVIGEKGDVLQFRGERKKYRGETAKVFNILADVLAVMSFLPGGVTFLGDHWETKTNSNERSNAGDNRL